MTFDEFVNLRDPREGRLELHHGRVIQMPPRKFPHVKIQQALLEALLPHTRGWGFLTIAFPFRPLPQHEAWVADVGFVSEERLRGGVPDYLPGAPDLVIEVLSPSNTMDEILDRQSICRANGCSAFWTVVPNRQLVLVTAPDGKTLTFDRSMSVPLPEPEPSRLRRSSPEQFSHATGACCYTSKSPACNTLEWRNWQTHGTQKSTVRRIALSHLRRLRSGIRSSR